jgi:HEXXH motif-containing protein
MKLQNQIKDYLRSPVRIFNSRLAADLVECKSRELSDKLPAGEHFIYSTANTFLNEQYPLQVTNNISQGIVLEMPEFDRLGVFYSENGLEPLSIKNLEHLEAARQLEDAFNFLKQDDHSGNCVSALIKCVQALCQPEPEFDVSYSHPKIPFTVFVSIGRQNSENDILRLSESILHEAMHLKLTLIENIVQLVSDNTQTSYSPWRDENRPIRGVLHGTFVFRAVHDFYDSMQSFISINQRDFISWRIETIRAEINSLGNFYNNKGLSELGSCLANKLIHFH